MDILALQKDMILVLVTFYCYSVDGVFKDLQSATPLIESPLIFDTHISDGLGESSGKKFLIEFYSFKSIAMRIGFYY